MMEGDMKSYLAKTGELKTAWYVIDAADQVLGRLAVRAAMILMGKHRPEYTPYIDTGEFVIVVNAAKVKLTGNKGADKKYQWYTKYPSGLREINADQMRAKHPDRLVSEAIRRMLPKTKMGLKMVTKLKVYGGPDHPHQAQQPKELKL